MNPAGSTGTAGPAREAFRRLPRTDDVVDEVLREMKETTEETAGRGPAAGTGDGPSPGPGRAEVVEAARLALQELRLALAREASTGEPPAEPLTAGRTREDLLKSAVSITLRALAEAGRLSLRPVINATGVPLHTNLGRARLAPEAARAAAAAAGHVNLEFSLTDGARLSRQEHARDLLTSLTGAESALVVNNNAAAVWLALRGIARGGVVVISRGELVEIGESFRLPEIMAEAGTILREVGTTNRTTVDDYRRAFGRPAGEAHGSLASGTSEAEPRAIVLVHPSNYRVIGFASRPARRDVAAVAREFGVPVLEDLGSGLLHDLAPWGFPDEPTPRRALGEGVDLVTFSGDKLLGGPQCGVIAGRAALVDRLRLDPVLRCLRPDKLTLAALEATLRLHRDRDTALQRVPVLRALTEADQAVRRRAARTLRLIRTHLPSQALGLFEMSVNRVTAEPGGGSLPGTALPSWAVRIRGRSAGPDELWRRLAGSTPPVLGRRQDQSLVLDMRSVADDEVPAAARSVASALRSLADGPPPGAELHTRR